MSKASSSPGCIPMEWHQPCVIELIILHLASLLILLAVAVVPSLLKHVAIAGEVLLARLLVRCACCRWLQARCCIGRLCSPQDDFHPLDVDHARTASPPQRPHRRSRKDSDEHDIVAMMAASTAARRNARRPPAPLSPGRSALAGPIRRSRSSNRVEQEGSEDTPEARSAPPSFASVGWCALFMTHHVTAKTLLKGLLSSFTRFMLLLWLPWATLLGSIFGFGLAGARQYLQHRPRYGGAAGATPSPAQLTVATKLHVVNSIVHAQQSLVPVVLCALVVKSMSFLFSLGALQSITLYQYGVQMDVMVVAPMVMYLVVARSWIIPPDSSFRYWCLLLAFAAGIGCQRLLYRVPLVASFLFLVALLCHIHARLLTVQRWMRGGREQDSLPASQPILTSIGMPDAMLFQAPRAHDDV